MCSNRTTGLCGRGAARKRPKTLLCGLMMAAAMLAGCAAQAPFYTTPPAVQMQWPLLSSRPKIVWLKTIATYRDVGIEKGFWQKAVELLTGGSDTRISRPYGVLFDSGARLFVADPGAGCVHSMDTKEGRYSLIGDEGETRLRTPIGLAEDEQENLYITDSTAATVFVYDIRRRTLKPFLRQLKRPTGIVYNKVNKLLYIVDTVAGTVSAVDGQGTVKHTFGSPGGGVLNFNHPTDITVDRRGQIYVTDPLNYRVKVFSPEGQLVNQIGNAGDAPGELNKPKGVAVDSEGHIYVCDSLQDTVQIFDSTGALILNFGSNGTGNGQFWMPSGIFIDANDYIYIADTYNQRVQLFRHITSKEDVEMDDELHNGEPDEKSTPRDGVKP